MRAPKTRRPDTLTLPPDDRKLEDIIGSLQSEMGVPQNPQEYRLTIKIAEERTASNGPQERRDSHARGGRAPEPKSEGNGKPKREKAPAAPRVGDDKPSAQGEDGSSRRRRSRRRRRGGRGRGGSGKPRSG